MGHMEKIMFTIESPMHRGEIFSGIFIEIYRKPFAKMMIPYGISYGKHHFLCMSCTAFHTYYAVYDYLGPSRRGGLFSFHCFVFFFLFLFLLRSEI